ncbi:Alpha/Beta hydrolase protein [Xylariales sp. PMI_506]|nr:Alpha/Beta hydrolase protein [Xylariales sp. PMI_506]
MSGAYFSQNDSRIFYTVEGSGPPVLLIHGWACDQNDWAFQFPFLLNLGFCVIGVDLRGHGKSTYHYSSHPQLDPITFATDIAALITHLGFGSENPVILAGHSLGGVIANEIAFRHPELVRGIILVDASHYMTPPQMKHVTQLLKGVDLNAVPQTVTAFWDQVKLHPPGTAAWLRPWQQRRTWAMDPLIIAATFEQMQAHLGESGIEYLTKTKTPGIPRLVTCAAKESAILESEAGVDPNLDLVEVIAKGHCHHIVAPDLFNSVLERWLRERFPLPSM